jgi:ferrous iron transport protein A
MKGFFMRLLDVEVGKWVTVMAFDGGEKFQDRLLQHGLYPGDRARILRTAPLDGPLLVEVSGRELALGRDVAKKIVVEMVE